MLVIWEASMKPIYRLVKGKLGFLGDSMVRNLPANAGDVGSIPDPRRFPGEKNCNPLQFSCLGNPMERGASQAIVSGVANSWTQLSDWTTILKEHGVSELVNGRNKMRDPVSADFRSHVHSTMLWRLKEELTDFRALNITQPLPSPLLWSYVIEGS